MSNEESAIQKQIRDFFFDFPRYTVRKGTIFISADENPTGISFIEEGFVKQYVISPKGESLMLTIYKPGSFIPLAWGLNETPNKSNFESLTDIVVNRAPRESVVMFLKEHPDILYDRTQRLLLGISGMLERLETLVLDRARVRVARVLLYFGESFRKESSRSVRIPFSLPHKEIAAWTGLARETVSLELAKLVKKQVIHYQKRLIEVDLAKLRQELF